MNTRAPARRYDSVQQDWRGILPLAKGMSFASHTGQLEKAYLMFSVVLNEVITLRQRNDLASARLGVAVVGGLVLSQLLTLYITPVIYIYLDGIDRMLKRRLEPHLDELPEIQRPPVVAAE